MTNPYRAMCAELLADYDNRHYRSELSDRARALLAQPEPEVPIATEHARTQEINDLIAETVYGPEGSETPACANAWEVSKLIASLQTRVKALEALDD
jgi:hypothetical protein